MTAVKKKNDIGSRVLRFTVSSALVVAPLAGCGGSSTESPTESTTPVTLSNPGPVSVQSAPREDRPEPQTIEPEPIEETPDAGIAPGPIHIRTNSGPSN